MPHKMLHKIRHPTSIPGTLLPFKSYLVFTGYHILHPSPLFIYTGFSETTVIKLINNSVTINNTSNIRSAVHFTPQNTPEAEIIHQISIPLNNIQYPYFQSFKSTALLHSNTPSLPQPHQNLSGPPTPPILRRCDLFLRCNYLP